MLRHDGSSRTPDALDFAMSASGSCMLVALAVGCNVFIACSDSSTRGVDDLAGSKPEKTYSVPCSVTYIGSITRSIDDDRRISAL
jgi:hypothetical protein